MVTEPAFDYRRQALLYLPRDLPAPPSGGGASDAYAGAVAARIEALVQASGGGAFCLFTSHRALRDAWRRLSGRLAFPVLRPGSSADAGAAGPVPRGRQCRPVRHAIVLGGGRRAGRALSLGHHHAVAVRRARRSGHRRAHDRLRVEGRNWLEFALPRATLLLKQGVGRLIRSTQDRGVVAILDSRLTTRRYGALVLDSLPPARRTDELADVYRFFRSRGR